MNVVSQMVVFFAKEKQDDYANDEISSDRTFPDPWNCQPLK